jgi:hypothetical protein
LNSAILRDHTQKLHRQRALNFIEAKKRPPNGYFFKHFGNIQAQATGKRHLRHY